MCLLSKISVFGKFLTVLLPAIVALLSLSLGSNGGAEFFFASVSKTISSAMDSFLSAFSSVNDSLRRS